VQFCVEEQFKWHAVQGMEVNRRNQHDRESNNFLAERIATFRQLIVSSVSNSKAGLVLGAG
jgi:hypothetical protein